MARLKFIILLAFSSFAVLSCKKSEYLNAKPDERLIVPKTLKEFQAVLDNDDVMNGNGINGIVPNFGEISADNFYILNDNFSTTSSAPYFKNLYLWNDDIWGGEFFEWKLPYRAVFYSNIVLDGLSKLNVANHEKQDYNNIRGSALFYRSFMFYQLAQLFAPHYKDGSTATAWGVPLRLSSDVNEKISRSTIQETYSRIIDDLKEAASLLPDLPLYKTRPSKAAAYGLLARTYQTIQNYDSALTYANACLDIQGTLLDYNSLAAPNSSTPIPRYNAEVIFHAVFIQQTISLFWGTARSRVDSTLFLSYQTDDLRKTVFFGNQTIGKNFKGHYTESSSLFGGIAVDEIYLIRAECHARKGNVTPAMDALNTLMIKRWKNTAPYTNITANDPADALNKILIERRKELLFRGSRWTDLRRLNNEGANIIVTRKVGGVQYNLMPDNAHYTFLIPPEIIGFNPEMPQNPR